MLLRFVRELTETEDFTTFTQLDFPKICVLYSTFSSITGMNKILRSYPGYQRERLPTCTALCKTESSSYCLGILDVEFSSAK